jgi:hypothetical protein
LVVRVRVGFVTILLTLATAPPVHAVAPTQREKAPAVHRSAWGWTVPVPPELTTRVNLPRASGPGQWLEMLQFFQAGREVLRVELFPNPDRRADTKQNALDVKTWVEREWAFLRQGDVRELPATVTIFRVPALRIETPPSPQSTAQMHLLFTVGPWGVHLVAVDAGNAEQRVWLHALGAAFDPGRRKDAPQNMDDVRRPK